MEQLFTISQGELQVPCVLTEPEDGDIRRIVIGVHGLGGSTRDRIQTSIAEEMDMFYAATVRFDFPGHGENPLADTYMTFDNAIACLTMVAQWAKERYPDVEDLCIFATGFGAYVALHTLDNLLELPGKVKLVVQTPSVMAHKTVLAMRHISEATLWAMEKSTFRSGRPFDLTYSFYESLRDHPAIATYPIPMLILQGEFDNYIDMEDIQNFRRINEDSKLVIIPGASHRFLEEGAWDMVLDLTRDWFAYEQVLLCDWE